MANKTFDYANREEYLRVVREVSREDFNKARDLLENNPQQFYNQLVVLLWNAEDWEVGGEDFEEDSVQRNIFDTIQGIAVRDHRSRYFNALCKRMSAKYPEWSKEQVLEAACKKMEE